MGTVLLVVVCLFTVVAIGGCVVIHGVGGASSGEPRQMRTGISANAKELIRRAFADVDHRRLADYHVHALGTGAGDTGNWVSPGMQSWLSPVRRLKFSIYADAGGIEDLAAADSQYARRLVDLVEATEMRGRYYLLAFDYNYADSGARDLEHSEFYTANEYVFRLAEEHPDFFEPVMSVHPYREDALAELEKWAARGGKLIKWLPAAMNIDASDPRLDPYYEKVKQLGLVILTHTGEEKAVDAEAAPRLGNPLLFRRPLDKGVTLIMAHCASLGDYEDLDHPERGQVSSFELFLRLMDEREYEGVLWADISALTQFNRSGVPLRTMLQRTDLHPRLVNGSDYPLPAINIIIRTAALVDQGYITATERTALNEIYDYNPLLFDFVLKRTVRAPTGERFAPEVFYARDFFSSPVSGAQEVDLAEDHRVNRTAPAETADRYARCPTEPRRSSQA